MPPFKINPLLFALCLLACDVAGADSWPQGDASEFAVPVEVSSVSEAPPALTFRLWDTRFPYTVYRKAPADTDWGFPVDEIPAGVDKWTDADVAIGTLYHYRFHQAHEGGPYSIYDDWVNAYCLAGIRVDRTQPQGRVVIVMPESIQIPLADDLAQFKQDLAAEGWIVHTVPTPDGADLAGQDPRNAVHVGIRDDIRAIYNAHPGEVKQVILFGRVPVARSGSGSPLWRPDGHGILGANAADAWYADVDNTWTDLASLNPQGAYDLRSEWLNFPGDGRWDQINFTDDPDAFEMGWGRIDFRQPLAHRASGSELEALRSYLRKLHRYKTASDDFRPGRRGISRGGFDHNDEDFAREIAPLTGLANMEFITRSDWNLTAPGDADAGYSNVHGPYFFYMKGDMAPSLSSNLSRALIWSGWQSHFGYWDYDWNMAARIGEPDSFTLAWTWNALGLRYSWHLFGMGNCLGDVMRGSINNQGYLTGLYGSRTNRPTNDYQGWLFMNILGDPTIRLFPVKPVTQLNAAFNPATNSARLVWLASPEATAGYHVYTANAPAGPYTRLTTEPIHPGSLDGPLSWVDPDPLIAPIHYMVRAIRLESTGGGTYLNPSIATSVSAAPPPRSYSAWQASIHWLDADSNPAADPDRDQYPNRLEYALGTNPLKAFDPASPPITIQINPDATCSLLHSLNSAASDVVLIYEISANLSVWTPASFNPADITSTQLDFATVSRNIALDHNPEPPFFLRIRVE